MRSLSSIRTIALIMSYLVVTFFLNIAVARSNNKTEIGTKVVVENDKLDIKKSCDRGALESCVDLGIAITDTDKDGAKNLYKKACEGGVARGCYYQGLVEYNHGYKKEAKQLYKLACDGEWMLGCTKLGNIIEDDGGKEEAKALYKQSCDRDEMIGCNNIGFLEYRNNNIIASQFYYKRACSLGWLDGCSGLGLLGGETILKNFCDGNNTTACYALGKIQEKTGKQVDAFKLYNKACDGGEKEACPEAKSLKKAADVFKQKVATEEKYVGDEKKRIAKSGFTECSSTDLAGYLTPFGSSFEKNIIYIANYVDLVQKLPNGYMFSPNRNFWRNGSYGNAFLYTKSQMGNNVPVSLALYYAGEYKYTALNGFPASIPAFRHYVGTVGGLRSIGNCVFGPPELDPKTKLGY